MPEERLRQVEEKYAAVDRELSRLEHTGAAPSSALARLLDALFAVTAATALFFFAMASGDGRLGTWELAAALLGFLLYMHLLSPLLLPPMEKIFRAMGKFLERTIKRIKKVQNKLKNLFPKIRECFRIKE